jgi:hypothetical protein
LAIKTRKILKKDHDVVREYILKELKARKASKFRTRAERIWRTVDRQVSMEPVTRTRKDSNAKADWRSAIELGEISRASEILSAEIRRLSFPHNRAWFDAHCEMEGEIDEEGNVVQDAILQKRVDGSLRALMTQQHQDFGFKSRTDLSIKEALHHGSYVVEARFESLVKIHDGTGVSEISAPVWIPHSMWNCYPDPNPSVIGTNMFYNGSMIIVSYKPLHEVRKLRSDNPDFPYFNLKKIKRKTNKNHEEETEDVELITFFGDLVIPRNDGDILLLNYKATVANDELVHLRPNILPFPEIIYNGYERLDVRDPYYVSPLIKMAPTQLLASTLANKFIDGIELKTEPPVGYDGNDPDFVMNGGPDLSPGAKFATKGGLNFNVVDVGDPGAALAGAQFMIEQIQAGTSVDKIRAGVAPGTERTATEVLKTSQGSEIRTVDFVDKHEQQGLRPFLYMQHELNKRFMERYAFFNQEVGSPDFERVTKDDLPENCHFEVVGSKGILGEEQRQQMTSAATAFWIQVAPEKLNTNQLIIESYRDAGNKNPERFLKLDGDDEIQQVIQQAEQAIQESQGQIQQLQDQLTEFQFQDEEHSLEMEQERLKQEQLSTDINQLQFVIEFLKREKANG